MHIQTIHFEGISEILHMIFETNMLKAKVNTLNLNKKHNNNTRKGANVRYELQIKQHVKRRFNNESQLIEHILIIFIENCKTNAIVELQMVADFTLKVL